MRFVRWFAEVGLSDVDLVGGKNASLGEMIRELSPLGIRVPDGFAITAEAYREFLKAADLEKPIRDLLSGVRRHDLEDLVDRAARIRKMIVGSDLAASGVIFTLDPESGHREMVLVTASYGLGEAVVQGQVIPDQFYVHKPTLRAGFPSIVWRTVGSKEQRMVYASSAGS